MDASELPALSNVPTAEEGINYIPVPPFTQVIGLNPYSGPELKEWSIKLDQNNVPVEIWDETLSPSAWRSFTEFLSDPFPNPIQILRLFFDEATKQAISEEIISTGLFKAKTEYIIIGDEPTGGTGVVDLKAMLTTQEYDDLKKYLKLMPRSILWDFFMKKIWPSLPDGEAVIVKPFIGRPIVGSRPASQTQVYNPIYGGYHIKKGYEDMMWAAFIDLFNEANLAYINEKQIDPWTWEQEKTDAYYVSSSAEAINALEAEISAYNDVSLALDPKAKVIMEQYLLLPKIGDTGLEINRQNAIKELLKKKDYVTAQAVLDAFRYINDTELGISLSKPIPYDVTSADGGTVVKATN